MCFSIEASFGTSVVTALAGVGAMRLNKKPGYWAIALIPFLFAIQQFSEGFVWYSLMKEAPAISTISANAFLFFAFGFWPFWIPFSCYLAETNRVNKTLLLLFTLLGGLLALLNIAIGIQQPLGREVVGGHIVYIGNLFDQTWPYLILTTVPFLISSVRHAWVFGGLIVASFAIAFYIWETEFVSVWCFFVAICSIALYFILRFDQRS